MFVDSHCHLEYDGLIDRREEVLANAASAGVGTMLNISTKASEWDAVIATANREEGVWASVGIHPHEADDHGTITVDAIKIACDNERVIGVGETGLDYFYEHSDRVTQQALFRRHIEVSRDLSLPTIIHTRDAEADTLDILKDEMRRGDFPALIHCFTASAEFAEAVLGLGLYISLSGIVTFKNAKDLQSVARTIPIDRLLIETDSPFLAPVPHRGKKCEPAFVADTAAFLAELRGEDVETLAATTADNFFRLFAKATPESLPAGAA